MDRTMFDTTASTTATEQAGSFMLTDYMPERRRHARRNVRFRAEARRMDNASYAQRAPKLALTVLDVSEGGLRATSRSPVLAGERLCCHMPPESGLPQRVFGKVIRCSARKDGYALAIKFDYVPAA